MNIIKRFFKNIIPSNETSGKTYEEKVSKRFPPEFNTGGNDLDDKIEVASQEDIIDQTVPNKVEPVAKKKPGRPKGSTNKKTPSKKTPSKKTPSKKV